MRKGSSYLSCVKFRSSTFKDSSKCERLIELARKRIANLIARTKSMISFLCEDIAHLLQRGLREKALHRVEQVYQDQRRLSAYAQIDELCSAALKDFDIICRQSELKAELKIVVCTLIFAASRYGELPELNKIRNLFREWWGDELISTNVNLLPGNLVNPEIKEMLIITPPNDAKKLELVNEIASSHNIILGFESKDQNFKSHSQEEEHESEKIEMEVHDSLYPQDMPDSSSPSEYKNMHMKMENHEESSSRSSFDSSNQSREEEIVYLDNNMRLKSPSPHNNNMRMKSPPPPYKIHPK